jgi:hypothetical protein
MYRPCPIDPRRVVRPGGLLVLVLLTTLPGCYQEPSRWDEVQKETRGKKAVAREAVAGGEFNKMFPKAEGDFSLVYTQEKTGFAQAMLKKGGDEVATLSISDTVSSPDAAADYKDSTEQLQGYPMVDKGENGTAVLVGDRFQVTVRSKDANFTKADRQEWLGKFDLANLARLAKLQ